MTDFPLTDKGAFDMSETTTTGAEQVELRCAEIKARQDELRAQEQAIKAEQTALAEESHDLANRIVRSWVDPTPEQLLSLCGTDAVREIVDGIIDTHKGSFHIRANGYSTEKVGQYFHPRQFGLLAHVDLDLDAAALAAALVKIADALRIGDGTINVWLVYREDSADQLAAGLANGKTSHYLCIADAEHAEVVQLGYKETVISTGTPAEALAKAIEVAYTDSLPW